MKMKRFGWVANALTVLRIILSISLPFLPPLQTSFMLVYAVCGITDALDGVIARKTHTQSKLGARLDSVADFILVTAMIISLYPVVMLPKGAIAWTAVIAAIRFLAAGVSFVKHRTFALLHTYANKATGFLLFLVPFFLPILAPAVLVWILLSVASLSAIEELLIQISAKTLNLDRISIFSIE